MDTVVRRACMSGISEDTIVSGYRALWRRRYIPGHHSEGLARSSLSLSAGRKVLISRTNLTYWVI